MFGTNEKFSCATPLSINLHLTAETKNIGKSETAIQCYEDLKHDVLDGQDRYIRQLLAMRSSKAAAGLGTVSHGISAK